MSVRTRARPSDAAMVSSSLFASATWLLQPGLAALPRLRHIASVMLIAAMGMVLAWLLAIGLDVMRGGRSVWVLVACVPTAWLCWRLLRSAWVRCHMVQPKLSLVWAGEVQNDPPAGGWRLNHFAGTPVEVQCLLDAQGWLLCQIQPIGKGAALPPPHWCWINARDCPDLHRFRTLLCLPSHLTTAVGGASDGGAPAMASWPSRRHPSGIALRESFDTFMPTQPVHSWPEAVSPTSKGHS